MPPNRRRPRRERAGHAGGLTVPVERLQRALARAGFGSRRSSEELIAAGLVTVNGRVATLGDKVDPAADRSPCAAPP